MMYFAVVSLSGFEPVFFSVNDRPFVLRPLLKTDRTLLAEFGNSNHELLAGPFPITMAALTGKRSEIAAWVSNKIEGVADRKGLFCVIQDLQTQNMVGFISAFQFEWRTPKCELSWMVSAPFQRNGIAQRCCESMIRFLFARGVLKVICRVSPENEASIKLANRLGFQKEGLHQRDFRDGNNNLLDVLYFGLLA